MPLEAGDYELRYVQGGKKVLARAPITVNATQATLSAPASTTVGAAVKVTWSGPDTRGDFVTVTASTASARAFQSYAYTRSSNPATIFMPLQAGNYELRYVQSGKKVLATQAITVTDVIATLSAPETTIAGTLSALIGSARTPKVILSPSPRRMPLNIER